ncbi:MAG: T9SS type A sorting domain-containing protein [Lewinellaceae bacterium]|nr:T9SS type A sorting domain-containing protein [Lewinellaceae bacterium]
MDNIWILGRDKNPFEDTIDRFGGTSVDFNFLPPKYSRITIHVDMEANASISDSSGNLLFYTDGCSISNKLHGLLKNGDGINAGGLTFVQGCVQNTFGYPTHQGVMILPFPGHANTYVLLHLRKPDPLSRAFIEDVLYSVIDMYGDGGLGEVTAKNQLIAQDTFCDMLTATRHGNGRDWWVVVPRYNTAEYYVFLLSPEGISLRSVQQIGAPIKNYTWAIQATFSPDGSKYANNAPLSGLQIFDFDRCSGFLSNAVHNRYPGDTVFACGVAISSSSRYLYASTRLKLYQFDLYATRNIEASRELVGVYDGFADYFSSLPTTFYQMMLAPDKKIYMTCTTGNKYWHIIHTPDKRGVNCALEQHFELPTVHSFSPPNFPHFRLFDAQGSPCDTLGIDGPPPPRDTMPPAVVCRGELRIFPNPASVHSWLELPDCQKGGMAAVYDITGRWVTDWVLEPDELRTQVDVSTLVSGVYVVRVQLPDGKRLTKKLLVVR